MPRPICLNLRYAHYLPPRGRLACRVFQPEPLELAYLSWGHRWYGDAPVEAQSHDGWHYFVVLAGGPTLRVGGQARRTEPGFVSICHPDTPVGHEDEPGASCRMLTWVWRTPPASTLSPSADRPVAFVADGSTLRRLNDLHARCRAAMDSMDEHTPLRLRAARLQLDLLLASGRPDPRRAADFLLRHPGHAHPVQQLCDHLQVSGAGLRRLFHRTTGRSPRTFALECRLNWARQQLQTGTASVKAVAFALGYRKANDFSRAFKRHHGVSPREAIRLRPALTSP